MARKPAVDLADSVRQFRSFNARDPESLSRVKLDLRRPLVRIGEVPEIHYLSDKEGKPAHYYHKVRSPGVMYADPRGKFFVILGGSTRVRGRWLRENPSPARRQLSKENMSRAIRSYDRLTPADRRKVQDEISWILAEAWRIQKAGRRATR